MSNVIPVGDILLTLLTLHLYLRNFITLVQNYLFEIFEIIDCTVDVRIMLSLLYFSNRLFIYK